jgi:uncharacterized membrane protein
MSNVNNVDGLASVLGYTVSSLSLKYLGISLGVPFKKKYIWNGVIEKTEHRLAS